MPNSDTDIIEINQPKLTSSEMVGRHTWAVDTTRMAATNPLVQLVESHGPVGQSRRDA